MLPKKEIEEWLIALATAIHYARRGRIEAGYACLANGLRTAQCAQDEGQPWAETLADRYSRALDLYAAHFASSPS